MSEAILQDHNVRQSGNPSGPVLLFAHGFGCDQSMWRFVAPAFEQDYRVIRFDYVGAGDATRPYDPVRYATLDGYAEDVVEIIRALDIESATFIGHSVSSMIGALVSKALPDRIDRLVMISPSPRYINDGDYHGGFAAEDISELLENLEGNYIGWSKAITPAIIGEAKSRSELVEELNTSFCRMDPDVALAFARATFEGDNRADLPEIRVPTLVIQCRKDNIAPPAVGEYTAEQLPRGELVYLETSGHCPQLSAPQQTTEAITAFLN